MTDVQIFTSPKNKTARKAERFFKERGIAYHAVDIRRKAPAPGELTKWVRKFGVDAVLDKNSKPYVEGGLAFFSAGQDDWIAKMAANPEVLNLPLVRCGRELAVGDDPEAWKRFAQIIKG